MALTGTDRGAGSHASSATTVTLSPGSNFTPGSCGALCIAFDNSGTGGLNPLVVSSFYDSVGNTWQPRLAVLNDPSNANLGLALGIFTCPNIARFDTSDTLVLSFGAFSVPAKAWAFHEVTCAAGSFVAYRINDSVVGVAGANPTRTSPSVTNGEMLIAAMGSESAGAITPDADATNGAWSTHQTASAGLSGTSNIEISSQRKVVTATATQSYDITLASSDWAIGMVILTETLIPSPDIAATARVAG